MISTRKLLAPIPMYQSPMRIMAYYPFHGSAMLHIMPCLYLSVIISAQIAISSHFSPLNVIKIYKYLPTLIEISHKKNIISNSDSPGHVLIQSVYKGTCSSFCHQVTIKLWSPHRVFKVRDILCHFLPQQTDLGGLP